MTLSQLKPGTAFHLPAPLESIRGTLREVHGGGAVVTLSRPKVREFETLDGRFVTFRDPGRKVETWSAATPVIPE